MMGMTAFLKKDSEKTENPLQAADRSKIPEEEKNNQQTLLLLHGLLMLYSLGGICSKLAAQSEWLSPRFFLLYGAVLLNLAIYAIAWQQILKCIPLVTAYANKAVTVIWGLIWGFLFFGEAISVQKIVGALIIICGIVMVVKEDGE